MKLSILVSFLLILTVAHAHDGTGHSTSWSIKSLFFQIKNVAKHIHSNVQKIWNRKDICHGLECPKYEVMKTTDDYELRCYPSYAWAGTTYEDDKLTDEIRKDMFMRLFHYIQGANVDKIKIKMTVPVATKVESVGLHPKKSKRYTMLFFEPFEHQTSPPTPTNTTVTIVRLPEICVYVKSFDWYTTDTAIQKNLKELETALKKDGISDYTDPDTAYFYGGYDSPWTLPFWRHNEVWLKQK